MIGAALLFGLMTLDRVIFLPDRHLPAPPPGVEERGFSTVDGVQLSAWWVPPPSGAPVLV